MNLADLFDNSKWETHEVAAVPKRGGEVERRRYIGGGQAPSAATVAASTPTNEKDSSIFGGLFAPKDVLGISNFSGPFESGEQYVGGDKVYRKGGMSYDVADPSRHHARFNPGGHGAPRKPEGDSYWKSNTIRDFGLNKGGYDWVEGNRPWAPEEGLVSPREETGIIDSVANAIAKAKDFGSNAVDTVGEYIPQSVKDVYDYVDNPPASTITPEAVEQREAQKGIGNVDTMVFDQIERAIMAEFEDPSQRGKWSEERAYYQQLLAGGMDKSTAAIMAAREFGHPTRKTRDERRREGEAEKLKTLQFLKDSGQLQTAPNGTQYIPFG